MSSHVMSARLIGVVRDAVRCALLLVALVRERAPRPLRWLWTRPERMTTLAWLVGLLVAGHARGAIADDVISGPDLAGSGPRTLFETYSFSDYGITVKPDDSVSGWLDVALPVYQIMGVITLLLVWLVLGVLEGALTLLEWLLNLTLYAESSDRIDQAVNMVAYHVFWPLIMATVAIGAVMTYARWRGEGRGFATDLGWVIATAATAMLFASGPSTVMTTVDGARQQIADGVIAGSTQFVAATNNPTGFPTPPITDGSPHAGTRRLVDSMWSNFGATPWCLAHFNSLDVCGKAGHHALANDDTWKRWMAILDAQGAVPEFGPHGDYIRGQDPARLGIVLLLALLVLPLALLLIRLVIAGLNASVGLLLALVAGLVFLTLWPIPGWPRATGTRYLVYTVGRSLQALTITTTVSGVTVTSTIIVTLVGHHGFFIVTVLTIALMTSAGQMQTWMDSLTGGEGARTMGVGSALIARSVARTAVKAVGGVTRVAAGAARVAGGAAIGGVGLATAATRAAGNRFQSQAGTAADIDRGPVQANATRIVPSTTVQPYAPGPGGRRPRPHGTGPVTAITSGPGLAVRPKPSPRPDPEARSGATFDAERATAVGPRRWVAPPGGSGTEQATGDTHRVWVIPPGGRGLAAPDKTPPPPARSRRGVHRISTGRPRPARQVKQDGSDAARTRRPRRTPGRRRDDTDTG
ncbi:hypothetical protein ACFFSW_17205 [Saccharothrix longispora]|uniref:TrbL/VirB6 plasmid conjugal transfer protein n=1 Tax=Saccharothrix longispora TaxID=33920 RepID=A0ABU1PSJ0_9PSEU|nr:hypothetical protein [Saccharothrix longispora]MDR6593617.1 hypothetical protein [Saccharothrix longispora]